MSSTNSPIYTLRLGTRKSPLALAQAEMVRQALEAANPGILVHIIPMMTSGDAMQAGPLSEIGGKGLFTKEIEDALLTKKIDIAVHSAKDMQTKLPEGLILACTLPREDARDALIAPGYDSIGALPHKAILGTASLRRAAQALAIRPDLTVVPFRGNVQTRLSKLERGEVHATLLAMAGMKRLKLDPLPGMPLSIEQSIPAVAQGAIGIECRRDDNAALRLLSSVNHAPTLHAIECERALLEALDGSCRTPIAGYAEIRSSHIHLRAMLASSDGTQCWFAEGEGMVEERLQIGYSTAERLKKQAATK